MTKSFIFPEGATPLSDCSGLIPPWIQNLSDLNRAETENILRAQRKYLRGQVANPKTWFLVDTLKTIHKTMFENVWSWAGLYRKSVTSIGIKPGFIPVQLAEFCLEVRSWPQHSIELTFVEMAARIHHRLVSIHPFENGNGRFARLIADRFLLAWKCPHPFWPDYLNQEGSLRKDYIQTLKNADNGDYSPLVDFMKKFGASDPRLTELLGKTFYRSCVRSSQGPSIIRALIRCGANPKEATINNHRSLQLAAKGNLQEILEILTTSNTHTEP